MSAEPRLYDLEREDLAGLLSGEPSYRVDQLWEGLYGSFKLPAEMTNLPRTLREGLEQNLGPGLTKVAESLSDDGDTVKWLWRLGDGATVETVLMHYPAGATSTARNTVCVSTQAGCAMACSFCATGQAGFERHLTVGEIVEQVVRAQRHLAADPPGSRPGRGVHRRGAPDTRVSNIVFMGMGEPLANPDGTWPAIQRIHRDIGVGARHMTVSTVGLVPGIRRMAEQDLPVNLAVSLHAAHDELRDELVPINR
ncbi:MAG: radical SAM protein, partial [Microthrixaceae bacterium]|nr:radical SAM protein [Microthrixaceae bacterium]